MKALKTAIFAATMMSGATAMAAEVSGNVQLVLTTFSVVSIRLAAKRCLVVSM